MHNELSTLPLVRDAKPQDVPRLVGLINALNQHEGLAPSMTEAHAEYMLFSARRPVPLQCSVALQQHYLVGFVLYYRGYDTASTSLGYHVADIFVDPERRAKGIGRALMREVATRCLNDGGQWCSLTSASSNQRARIFYDTLGFHTADVLFRTIGISGMQRLSEAS